MGTGIFAITSFFYAKYIPLLRDVSIGLFYLNIAIFILFLIPWSLRWILFKKEAINDLNHPIFSNFYATIAIAMLVLASNFIILDNNIFMGKIVWFIGAISTIFFAIVTPFIMFKGDHVKIEHINPAWYIPPVGLIVIPIAGSLLIPFSKGIEKEIILIINYIGWGSGFFLYLALFSICMYRFILHNPLPNTIAPTIWINLGPIGAGSIALINLIKYSSFISIKEPFFIFAFLFWGFGIWWVIISLLITSYYIFKIKLPYAMSWWAFTFPLGAYVAATHVISNIFHIELIDYIGFFLYILLFILWNITFVKTLFNAYHGKVFKR